MIHASESQHWYTTNGEPCYTVTAKAGHQRPATLADARKMGLVPGVSTILGCCAKPGLEVWKIDQAILSALTLPKLDGESSDSFVSRVKLDAKETARKAAERGTAIHAALQGAFEDETPTPGYEAYIQGACSALEEWSGLPHGSWKAEHPFAHPLGFGGKCDLHARAPNFVCDFKTKEFDATEQLKTWDEHAMQLAAYRAGLGLSEARCAIVYVSSTVPGLCKVIEIQHEELLKGWKCFYSLLHFWQAKTGYSSSFERLAA